jgi:hypothetical protein
MLSLMPTTITMATTMAAGAAGVVGVRARTSRRLGSSFLAGVIGSEFL